MFKPRFVYKRLLFIIIIERHALHPECYGVIIIIIICWIWCMDRGDLVEEFGVGCKAIQTTSDQCYCCCRGGRGYVSRVILVCVMYLSEDSEESYLSAHRFFGQSSSRSSQLTVINPSLSFSFSFSPSPSPHISYTASLSSHTSPIIWPHTPALASVAARLQSCRAIVPGASSLHEPSAILNATERGGRRTVELALRTPPAPPISRHADDVTHKPNVHWPNGNYIIYLPTRGVMTSALTSEDVHRDQTHLITTTRPTTSTTMLPSIER